MAREEGNLGICLSIQANRIEASLALRYGWGLLYLALMLCPKIAVVRLPTGNQEFEDSHHWARYPSLRQFLLPCSSWSRKKAAKDACNS